MAEECPLSSKLRSGKHFIVLVAISSYHAMIEQSSTYQQFCTLMGEFCRLSTWIVAT